ncbi:sigma factor-like helix-turn-helix DNA-binding protein [Paenibacillus filicis]|uniref:Sigma factor-like helix-turn-helix DNA-binding protein n=1 Tax=Paenibacillus filicis TaxID=669464 RepID=A0ABU9DNV4_9BACL
MHASKTIFEHYQAEIYRIAWRLQYKAKVARKREISFTEIEAAQASFTAHCDNKLFIQELLSQLPPQGRTIIRKLFIEEKTEAEVAKQLNISQQAVNKWKKKMIQQLSRIKCS